ncbi:MAG: hypothetical protein RLZZ354_516 [Pseudomonadota bacterium]|jgi:hypothetical protein
MTSQIPKSPELLLKNAKSEIYQTRNNIKQPLLNMGGYKNIYDAKRVLGINNANEVYELLLDDWNRYVDNENKLRNDKYKKQLKKYNEEQVRITNEKVKQQVRARVEKKQEKKESNKINSKLKSGFKNNNSFTIDITGISIKELIKLIKKNKNQYAGDKKVLLKMGENNYYALNDATLNKLSKLIENNYIAITNTSQSDADVVAILNNFDKITLEYVDDKSKNKNRSGGFFNYSNNSFIDLSRYGIYTKSQFEKINWNKEDECLVNSLRAGGMSNEKIEYLKTLITNLKVPLCRLNIICDKLQIKIIIKKSNSRSERLDENTYGKEYTETYNLCYFEEHFFINETTEYTSYSVKNYEKIKDIKNFNTMSNFKRYVNSVFMSSFNLVNLLFELNHFEKLTYESINLMNSQYYGRVDNYISDLSYNEVNVKEIENKEREEKIIYENVFADFETYCNEEKQHTPYLAVAEIEGELTTFYGENCGKSLLKALNTNTRLIFHNATYDFNFLIRNLTITSVIMKGNMLMNAKGMFGKLHIEVKCSYHLISIPLNDFNGVFGLENSIKEVIPYEIYNVNDNINRKHIPINECLDCFKYEIEKKRFIENAKKWECVSNGTVDIIRYSRKYCEIDVIVLRKGYNIFKKWIDDLLHLNIDVILTSASLAHKYFINQGCYEGVYKLSGISREFLQKFVIGGRTMISENKKKSYLDDKPKNDFDATSLYPSAMNRLDGFLLGVPKVIQPNATYDDIKNYSGYFVEIIVKSVGLKRNFPLMSFIDDNGVRQFTNEMVDRTYYVDKIGLEDLINFQNVEFEIVKGYYFNDGFNTKIKEVINYLFEERALKKKQGNKCEMIYKLIMNSGYGKSIMKTIESEVKIFNCKEKLDIYLSRNYHWVKEIIKINQCKTVVKVVKSIDDHYNIAQVGVSILSMSKRIMNEVMCLGEDMNIKMFYQDTDSIHIYDEDIKKLSSAFSDKYNRDLIGKKMGQFHSDFDGEIYIDENNNIIEDKKIGKKFYKKVKMENVFANRSIFLGKKCYIDELYCYDEMGKKYIDYHIRMKGIPNSTILHTAKLLEYPNPFELYKDLSIGKEITFDLTEGGFKANFEKKKDFTIYTKSKFDRMIKFK